jgi:hypothetical protein
MRTIKKSEYDFLAIVFDSAGLNRDEFALSRNSQVEEMADGEMGSLRFCKANKDYHSKFGRAIVQGEFADRDGVPVSFTVNVYQRDAIFELDLWKVDFSPLQHLPAAATEVRIG